MKYTRVHIDSLAYELAPNVVTSDAIEQRLAPAYRALRLQAGQLYALTGIRERRYWDPGQTMADGALRAARRALETASIDVGDLGMLIYAGVCRDNLEPATACAVADGLGLRGRAEVYDISNACLGVLNGLVHVADAIELGRIRAGIVVSCESARQIVDLTIERILAAPTMETLRPAVATLTGGSGAAAVVLADASLIGRSSSTGGPPKEAASPGVSQGRIGRRLLGGVIRTEPRHFRLCRWGPDTGMPATAPMVMQTDAAAVMEHGVTLGVETFRDLRAELGWASDAPDKTICHQVGAGHRATVLAAMELPLERDFQTFEYLGNIGTVSLPLTAAMAEERGFLSPGDRVGLLGIGSGLNCLMLGVEW